MRGNETNSSYLTTTENEMQSAFETMTEHESQSSVQSKAKQKPKTRSLSVNEYDGEIKRKCGPS